MGCAVGACLGCVVMGVERHAAAGLPRGPRLRGRRDRLGGGLVKAKRKRRHGRQGARDRGTDRADRGPAAARAGVSSRSASPPVGRLRRVAAGRRASRRPRRRGRASTCRSSSRRVLRLANPILVASGTFGYGIEYGDVVDVERLGAICCKGTTLKAAGRQPDAARDRDAGRDAELDRPPEPGRRRGHREVRAALARRGGSPVIVNVAGESVEDYVEVARRLDGVPGRRRHRAQHLAARTSARAGSSSPSTRRRPGQVTAAVRRATRPAAAREAVAERRRRPADRPGDRGRRRRRADGGQHAVGDRRRPGRGAGRSSATPSAGCPGRRSSRSRCGSSTRWPRSSTSRSSPSAASSSSRDVLDFLAVGAVAVQVGTAIFADPTLPVRLVDELEAECRRAGLDSYLPLDRDGAAERSRGRPSAKGVEYRPVTPVASRALPGTARLSRDMTTIRSAVDEAARGGHRRAGPRRCSGGRARCARAISC